MRICWGQYALLATVIALALGSALAGCGSKGSLYMPAEQKQGEQKQDQKPNQGGPAQEQR